MFPCLVIFLSEKGDPPDPPNVASSTQAENKHTLIYECIKSQYWPKNLHDKTFSCISSSESKDNLDRHPFV